MPKEKPEMIVYEMCAVGGKCDGECREQHRYYDVKRVPKRDRRTGKVIRDRKTGKPVMIEIQVDCPAYYTKEIPAVKPKKKKFDKRKRFRHEGEDDE